MYHYYKPSLFKIIFIKKCFAWNLYTKIISFVIYKLCVFRIFYIFFARSSKTVFSCILSRFSTLFKYHVYLFICSYWKYVLKNMFVKRYRIEHLIMIKLKFKHSCNLPIFFDVMINALHVFWRICINTYYS